MSIPIENLFCVMRVINASNTPLTVDQIKTKTWLSVSTVRRYTNRLDKEGLIDVKVDKATRHHLYMRRGLKV